MAGYPNYLPADRLFLGRLSEAVSSLSIRNHCNVIRTGKLAIRIDSFLDRRSPRGSAFGRKRSGVTGGWSNPGSCMSLARVRTMRTEQMKPEQWQRIEQLYHAALEREANDRAAFLAGACAGDESLRGEVESLLHCDDRAEGFIEAPALEIAARAMAADLNEPTSSQPEQRAMSATQNPDVATIENLKPNGKPVGTETRRIILVGLIFMMMSIGISVNSYQGIPISTRQAIPAGCCISMVVCKHMAACPARI